MLFPHLCRFLAMQTILPKKLVPGATIGIIAPASPQRDTKRLERGISYLERLGFRVVCGENLHSRHGGYLAGTDDERVADLHSMFADRRVDAIFCSRGGYGSGRLLPLINFDIIKKNPKIFVGFSDITALQLAIFARTGLITFSGAMPSVDMADGFDPFAEEWFWRVLQSAKPLGVIRQPEPKKVIKGGAATGYLIPANLSVLCSIIGSGFLPKWNDKILLLEDIAEETYRIDRMLTQLRLAGILGSIQGLATGYWSQSASDRSTPHRDVHEMISENAGVVNGPVVRNICYGHEKKKLTVPVGIRAKLSARGLGLTFLSAAVQA